MRYLKTLAVAVLAGAALLAVVGASPAAAETVLCTEKASVCPAGKADGVGTEIKMSLVGSSALDTSFKTITCTKSSITAKVTSVGAGTKASVEGLSFEECTCKYTVIVNGTLELAQIAGTDNATLTWSNTEITTICTVFGFPIHCTYVTSNTHIGTLTGGNPAQLTAAAHIPVDEMRSDGSCPGESTWTATYEVTSPKPLYFEPEEGFKETVLCTEKASPCHATKVHTAGTELVASLVSGSKSKLTTGFNNIECAKSSLTAKVTSVSENTSASLESLAFEECNCEVKVLTKGTLELRHIKGTDNATVKSTGTEITTLCSTISGNVHCIYKTEATDLGTLEGGNPAKIKIPGAEIPHLATDTRCNEGAKWDVEYEVTSPKPLYIEPEALLSETVLCTENSSACPTGKADGAGTEVKLSNSGTVTLDTSYKTITCTKSSINAKVTSVGTKVSAGVEALSFEGCNCEFKVIGKGTLELERISETVNATLKWSGTEITTNCTVLGFPVHCIYTTSNTDIGTLTGGNPASLTASVHIPVKEAESDGACPEESTWTATYEVTSPKPLYVEPE